MQVCLPVPLCYQNSVLLDNSRGGRDSGCQAPGRGWAPRARLREVWGAGDPCVPPLCSHGPCTGLRLPFPCHPGIAGASRHFTRLQARGCGFVALAASPGQCGQVTQQGGGCWGRRMRSCDCQCFAWATFRPRKRRRASPRAKVLPDRCLLYTVASLWIN